MAKELRETVRDKRLRETERLLQEERLGLEALATAFLQTHPHPERLMERLDRMAENAVDSDISPRARDAIIFGQQLFRRRIERHLLRQQELLPRDEPEELAAAEPEQASLLAPYELHGEQASALQQMRQRVLAIYRNKGVVRDRDLAGFYRGAYGGATGITPHRLWEARVFLTRQGLLARSGEGWDLVERTQSEGEQPPA